MFSIRTSSAMYDQMTKLFLMITNYQITVRLHLKWAVSVVNADGHLIFLMGLCGNVFFILLILLHTHLTTHEGPMGEAILKPYNQRT